MVAGFAMTLLPAFLGLAGQRLNRSWFRAGRNRSRLRSTGHQAPSVGAGWRALGRTRGSRHAWAYAVGVTVVLIAAWRHRC